MAAFKAQLLKHNPGIAFDVSFENDFDSEAEIDDEIDDEPDEVAVAKREFVFLEQTTDVRTTTDHYVPNPPALAAVDVQVLTDRDLPHPPTSASVAIADADSSLQHPRT